MLKDVKANFAQLDPASQRKKMSKALKQLMGSEPLRSPPGKPVRSAKLFSRWVCLLPC